MKKQRGEIVFEMICLVVFIILWAIYGKMSCTAKWKLTGYPTEWGPMQGCVVNVNGKWLPEQVIRDTMITDSSKAAPAVPK